MSAVVSETLIAVYAEHDCVGEGCPLCILIQRMENYFRQSKCAVFHPGFSITDILLASLILNFAVFRIIPLSAVRLKVKMNR
jgi:hypothetical protein